jgi:Lrp/AsnC family transcriptional regulator for asnA, asnC and gidA
VAQRIDHIDQAIIALLIEDGRMSSADIARRLGNVSERAVRYRIERLRTREIVDIKAAVKPRARGLAVTADVMVEVEPALVREVAHHMSQLEWVSYVAFSTGSRDLSIQIYARDSDELHRYVTDVVGRVPGVRKTTTMLVPRVVKDVYEWHIPDSCVRRKVAGKDPDPRG